jgi:subtilisin family serine protease
LYLRPLRELARINGGSIQPNGGEFILLIDIKSRAEPTYAALRLLLRSYSDVISSFDGATANGKSVRVILSGHRPSRMLVAEHERWASIDGRFSDPTPHPPPEVVPMISEDWRRVFGGRGKARLSDHERARLESIVARAHAAGAWLRFWGTPDDERLWSQLVDAHVDVIGTDNLARLRTFLTERQ